MALLQTLPSQCLIPIMSLISQLLDYMVVEAQGMSTQAMGEEATQI